MRLSILPSPVAVCRLAPDAAVPDWARGAFLSVTRTADELSVVCDDDAVPPDVQAERGWRALKLEGPIPFEMTGVAAALLAPLAKAQISIFLISTYDTDYLLLKSESFAHAVDVLRGAGYAI
ncbi:MAG TPA: ACT domain-containing protein [Thermoanaerobaculia bacterium]|nr:ACT domain-containing protein [Thermoanaerobaculia bacterium]